MDFSNLYFADLSIKFTCSSTTTKTTTTLPSVAISTFRDLSKQFWCPVDGTKKPNLLIEFSNSIFIKFYFKAYWCWTCIQNKSAYYVSSILSCLFPDVKRPTFFFRAFTPWTPTNDPSWACRGAFSTSSPPLAFYNFRKLNLCSKTDISKTAWINAWSFPYWLSFYFVDKFNFYWCCNTFLTNTAIDCFQLFLHAIIWKWCHCCYYQLLLYLHFSLIYMSVFL